MVSGSILAAAVPEELKSSLLLASANAMEALSVGKALQSIGP
jgi:hypothetical protein